MPRLLFSSLPADLTTAGLTEILSNPPTGISPPSSLNHTTPRPTDVKVLLSQLGRSRRMAFVGYKSQEQAAWIKDVWEGVWVDGRSGRGTGSRISVEWAKGIEECGKTRGVPQNTTSTNSPPKKKTKLEPSEKPQDSQFAEFMSLSNPRKNKSLVHEIMELAVPTPQQPEPQSNKATVPHLQSEITTTEEPNLPPIDSSSRSSSPPPVIGDDEDITDKEYLARRMKRKLTDTVELQPELEKTSPESKEWEQDVGENGDKNEPSVDQQANIPDDLSGKPPEPVVPSDEATILESGRLFLRNLAFSVTEEEIRAIFEPFGNVAQVHILLDHERKPKGLGYVSYSRSSDALEAYRKLDQSDFQGRLLHILPAVTRNPRGESSTSASKAHNTVKMEQDAKRKLESSKQFNWATLYMNSDAVASSVADRLKISKAELFNPDAQNPAVKLALAETHVINETKQFLEDNGIDVEAFEKLKSARSPTTILVKNIPYNTSTNVIKALFSEHGSVLKVLMPPSGTIAVVEMGDKEDTKSAFRSLSYKRIGNSVLYLEKAPLDLWKIDPAKPEVATAQETSQAKPSSKEEKESGEPGSTLFVKNLSFGTTSDALASRFSNLTGYLFSRIQTKPDPKNAEHRLSMGFGFVGFRTVDSAQQALQRMQGCYLDGHTLELKFAKRGREEEEKEEKALDGEKGKKTATNKLLIKNLPFEINKKELYELFGVYGKLKSIRLPKKLDRKSRGFGFVEYHTKKEAQEALKSLKFSHLLGRHLVIEYANDADSTLDLDHLRNSQSSFLNLPNPHQKKKFVGLNNLDDDDDDPVELDD
ncbi:Multiple RNA-binding domain-containing protein 1 [Puccinia graminis f. sp. tritici]|uniref:Multiple RNA-binding domain-containing protein 1 n=1 Tax=Puccinia graminis f. sp. tritici TaxID=56615 RepID=A0A5B0RCS6_PUCGR|nr:Multiple RNA-binding domain-containing protein 1 [Puccinia graminis f. sp. tritici]